METNYTKRKENGKTSWNKHELDDQLSTIRQVTLVKKTTPKHPIWGIQLEGSAEGFEEANESEWNEAVQEYRDYVTTCLD